jgi:hypothetical protein
MMTSPMMMMTSLLPVPQLLLMRCKSRLFPSTLSLLLTYGSRREEIRRQCIESEQKRRDELRDGYRGLKDALPFPIRNQASLLDRATTHIKYLEMTQQQLQTRLQQAENETARLRQYVLLPSVHHNDETDIYVKGK